MNEGATQDKNESKENINREKVNIDLERIFIDKNKLENDRYSNFLKAYEISIKPINEKIILSMNQVHSFAKSGMQCLFLLNGGAILAIPALLKIIYTNNPANDQIIACGFLYIVGLVLVAVAYFCAYMACCQDSKTLMHWENREKYDLMKNFNKNTDVDWNELRNKSNEEMVKCIGPSKWFRRAATIMSTISLFCFCFGSFSQARILSSVKVEILGNPSLHL